MRYDRNLKGGLIRDRVLNRGMEMLFVWSLVGMTLLIFFLCLHMVRNIHYMRAELGCIHDIVHIVFPEEILHALMEHELGGLAIHHIDDLDCDEDSDFANEEQVKEWDEGNS